jgi:Ca2+-binding EF-hand superfamily protein
MFDKAQVMEFKDAFSIMDTNSDGLVDIHDLKVTFERLGKEKEYPERREKKKGQECIRDHTC